MKSRKDDRIRIACYRADLEAGYINCRLVSVYSGVPEKLADNSKKISEGHQRMGSSGRAADCQSDGSEIRAACWLKNSSDSCAGHSEKLFRAVVLSDFHNNAKGNASLYRTIRCLNPQMILCCGDMVTAKFGRYGTDNAEKLLLRLADRYPVWMVNGNHEERMQEQPAVYHNVWDGYYHRLSDAGIRFLDDDAELIAEWQNGRKLYLHGIRLGLPFYRHRSPEIPDISLMKEKLGECVTEDYHILLAHHPDYFASYSRWGADLVLAGHIHGGSVRLPVIGGLIGGIHMLFPEYDRGLYSNGQNSSMIVSAGLGDHTIPVRINNPRELPVIDFYLKTGETDHGTIPETADI